ncbi:MAG: hypothetical protein AAFX78_19340 [Cyanobacteria bacterium J06638_20]
MDLRTAINRQRIFHIVSSYQLDGADCTMFQAHLADLLEQYPTPLIELSLAETLVDHWLKVPPIRGLQFLQQAHNTLKQWEDQPICSTLTPGQFQQITGLDPSPIFGPSELPPPYPIHHPS